MRLFGKCRLGFRPRADATLQAAAIALALGLGLLASALQAQAAICGNGQTLPIGGGEDLEVTGGVCTVAGGTYVYGNVNIYNKGVLEFADAGIDFWAKSILVENTGVLQAGTPTTPIGTKGKGLVSGTSSAVVVINLYGADQGSQDPTGPNGGKGIICKTDERCGIPADIWDSNGSAPVTLNPGTPAEVTDYFYQYTPLRFDGGMTEVSSAETSGGGSPFGDLGGFGSSGLFGDLGRFFEGRPPGLPGGEAGPRVGFFGYKVLAVSYGGTLNLFGKKGASPATVDATPTNSGKSWVRLNGSLAKGAGNLTLDRAVDWEKGDHIVITTTDYLPGHSEEVTITSGSGDTFNFTPGLQYPHNGSAYPLSKIPSGIGPTLADGTMPLAQAETRAAVALLSRSIVIASGGPGAQSPFPSGAGQYFGGHTIVRQGVLSYQVQGVEFRQLGQGGRLGHYPVHLHMLRKTAPGTVFVKDCSVNESMTRWYALHATQGATLQRDVGYLSIGHGFYLEDGTETDNQLYSNIGIFARAAVNNVQNLRQVPGILAGPGYPSIPQTPPTPPLKATPADDVVPYHSDWDHPTVFWIMNGWNDFQGNMAAGAGTCGVCYWLLPGANSGLSLDQKWESYASEQQEPAHAGTTPLKVFSGNYCTSAMASFLTVANTTACNGVQIGPNTPPVNFPVLNPAGATDSNPQGTTLAPSVDNITSPDDVGHYYPRLGGGGRFPTACPASGECLPGTAAACDSTAQKDCMITAIDHYTSSFSWAETNFAAIWLRPQWYLFINSVLSDVQNGGITFVTGGGYTQSDTVNGHWALARKSVFVGNTQSAAVNPFTSNAGPFNPGSGLQCALASNMASPGNYCLSPDDGVSFPLGNFANNQRLFSIYDGPSFEDSNAYLDITRTNLSDCQPTSADSTDPSHNCVPSKFAAAHQLGVPYDANHASGVTGCYLPNAAIAWKQPNGFYYPPAFHSRNLFFDNVDIRHFVIEPDFAPLGATYPFYCNTVNGTCSNDKTVVCRIDETCPTGGTCTLPRFPPVNSIFQTDCPAVRARYCTWNTTMFTGFTDIDRQTELNDDDGTLTGLLGNQALTGLLGTISVNQDPFFNAPTSTPECLSDVDVTPTYGVAHPGAGTAVTSPYDYVTTVIFPKCAQGDAPNCGADWQVDCTNQSCYGVPMYRQLLTLAESEMKDFAPNIRLAGQAKYQRSELSTNKNVYYIDTTASRAAQSLPGIANFNVFKADQTYYVFLVFAKPTTRQTYKMYVGKSFNPKEDLVLTRVKLPSSYLFTDRLATEEELPRQFDSSSGILTVTLDAIKLPNFATDYSTEMAKKCQPASFCSWTGSSCACATGPFPDFLKTECTLDQSRICSYAVRAIDCPRGGCWGFGVKLASDFTTFDTPLKPPPTSTFMSAMSDWNVPFISIANTKDACYYDNKLPQTKF